MDRIQINNATTLEMPYYLIIFTIAIYLIMRICNFQHFPLHIFLASFRWGTRYNRVFSRQGGTFLIIY